MTATTGKGIRASIKGLKGARQQLRRLSRRITDATEVSVLVIKQAIRARTIPYVPVDLSTLVNSERTVGPIETPDGYKIIFGYGGDEPLAGGKGESAKGTPVQEYAMYVHEGPQKNWQKTGASNRYLALGIRDMIDKDLKGILEDFGER